MFGSLLRQITHRRTFTPLYMQTRTNTYKREVVSDDHNYDKYNKKLEDFKNKDIFDKDIFGKDLFWPKYGSSIYDDKVINEFKKNNERED